MAETNLFAIRLLAALAGTVLAVFLLVVVLRKRPRSAADRLLTSVIAAAALWHAMNAVQGLLDITAKGSTESAFVPLQTALAILGPALLLHLTLVWASPRALRAGFAVYPLAALTWALGGSYALVAALAASAAILLIAAPRAAFYSWTAYSLLAWAVAAVAGTQSAPAAVASLLPLVTLAAFVYRFNVFDLLISRRMLFVFTLSAVTAVYLIMVRLLASWLELEYGAFGPVVETALVLGAAITWLPVYQLITRFFSRENRMHAEFGRRVIEEAAAILDPRQRAQYLTDQLGRTFHLRRAALVALAGPPQAVSFGPDVDLEIARSLASRLPPEARSIIHVRRLEKHHPLANTLAASGFNYLFPLYYQDRLTGVLLLDTSPRVFLDQTEPALLGLAGQISLSLESCRLSESKARLEKELIEQQHLATLGGFAATIAHEVKNPLSSIKTLAQLLQEDPDVLATYGRELAFIVGETNRLNVCVQQLLTFARPLAEANEDVALSELLENTAAFVVPEDAPPGVAIERRIEAGLKLAASDRRSIEQVVMNLLLNAIQASPANGRIVLEAGAGQDETISIRITDEGPGIPDGIRSRVFEPFFTTKPRGTGLGLAIVRKHVQHLGAEIDLVSAVAGGHGTSVTVRFPRERAVRR